MRIGVVSGRGDTKTDPPLANALKIAPGDYLRLHTEVETEDVKTNFKSPQRKGKCV